MQRLTERDFQGNKLVLKNSVECTTENIKKWSVNKSAIGSITIRGEAVDKLAAYEDAEEQGLLLKLPFSKDTPVYHIENKEVVERKLEQVVVALWLRETRAKDLDGISFGRNAICVHMDVIGKTVFLTQEQAEQKLKEMEP